MADRISEVRRATVNSAGTGAGGTYTPIAGESGYDILVVGMVLQANGADVITIQDTLTSLLNVVFPASPVGQQFSLPESNSGWIRANGGDDLDIVPTVGATITGMILYRMIPTGMEL